MSRPSSKSNKRNGQRKGRNNKRSQSSNDGMPTPSMGFSIYRLRTKCLGVPRMLNSTFKLGIQGFLPAASPATGQATVYSNSFFEPFSTTNPLTTGWSTFSLTDGTSTAGVFPGNALFSTGYAQYRVLKSKLTVTALAGSNGDAMNCWITPIVKDNSAATKFSAAVGQPGTKYMTLCSGGRPQSIVSNPAPHAVLGLTMAQYLGSDYAMAPTGSVPSSSKATLWQVSYATMDGGVTVGQVYFSFVIEVNVDFDLPLDLEL